MTGMTYEYTKKPLKHAKRGRGGDTKESTGFNHVLGLLSGTMLMTYSIQSNNTRACNALISHDREPGIV